MIISKALSLYFFAVISTGLFLLVFTLMQGVVLFLIKSVIFIYDKLQSGKFKKDLTIHIDDNIFRILLLKVLLLLLISIYLSIYFNISKHNPSKPPNSFLMILGAISATISFFLTPAIAIFSNFKFNLNKPNIFLLLFAITECFLIIFLGLIYQACHWSV